MERSLLRACLVLYIKLSIIIFLLMSCAKLNAQGISNLWLMGFNSGLSGYGGTNIDFYNGTADTSYVYRTMNFRQTCSSISNASGNLLFYTNGVYVANALNDTMQNGNNLNPSPYTTIHASSGLLIEQMDLILPIPGDSSRYFLFHETEEYIISTGISQPVELLYSMIDMTLDNGLGAVVFKNVPIISDTLLYGGITACKHANGRDWWIICHRYDSDIYYTLLLTPYGISGPYTQHIGQYIYLYGGGQSAFSPDGKKFARYNYRDDLDIFDFDRCTGLLSNYVHIAINDSAIGGGLAISPNSRFLYVSSERYVYQFDLTDTSIASTQTTVAVFDGFFDVYTTFLTNFNLSHLANDGKIYINTASISRSLHVINNPDSAGLGCNLTQHSFVLPTVNAFTVPNYPNFFLGADTTSSICDSLHLGIEKPKLSEGSLQIYYQPSGEFATIHAEELQGKTFSLSVFDLSGREVFKEEGKLSSSYFSKELNCQLFASGMYIVSLQTEKEKLVRRFVKE